MYKNDQRVVLTLDAGGTNFVFSAIRGYEEIVPAFSLPSHADHLDECLQTIRDGFTSVLESLQTMGLQAIAISFAFPGPADFRRGIIMDLNNMPAFRGGVPLKDYLEDIFHLPVFINNDADLFAYGECIAGALPQTNALLAEKGCSKQFNNLIGFTFGTGFGCGITSNKELYIGDNSSAGEIIMMRHKHKRDIIVEDGVSIRAIKRVYHEHCQDPRDLTPYDIFRIGKGELEGDKTAALKAFEEFGEVAGDGIAQAITLLDGLIVLGGGLCGGKELFMPALLNELNGNDIYDLDGRRKDRLRMKVFNLDDAAGLEAFCASKTKQIPVPGSQRFVEYDPVKRLGIVFSKLGTSKATSIGAYAFALHELDKKQ